MQHEHCVNNINISCSMRMHCSRAMYSKWLYQQQQYCKEVCRSPLCWQYTRVYWALQKQHLHA